VSGAVRERVGLAGAGVGDDEEGVGGGGGRFALAGVEVLE